MADKARLREELDAEVAELNDWHEEEGFDGNPDRPIDYELGTHHDGVAIDISDENADGGPDKVGNRFTKAAMRAGYVVTGFVTYDEDAIFDKARIFLREADEFESLFSRDSQSQSQSATDDVEEETYGIERAKNYLHEHNDYFNHGVVEYPQEEGELFIHGPLARPEVMPEEVDLPNGWSAHRADGGLYFNPTDEGDSEAELEDARAEGFLAGLFFAGMMNTVGTAEGGLLEEVESLADESDDYDFVARGE